MKQWPSCVPAALDSTAKLKVPSARQGSIYKHIVYPVAANWTTRPHPILLSSLLGIHSIRFPRTHTHTHTHLPYLILFFLQRSLYNNNMKSTFSQLSTSSSLCPCVCVCVPIPRHSNRHQYLYNISGNHRPNVNTNWMEFWMRNGVTFLPIVVLQLTLHTWPWEDVQSARLAPIQNVYLACPPLTGTEERAAVHANLDECTLIKRYRSLLSQRLRGFSLIHVMNRYVIGSLDLNT